MAHLDDTDLKILAVLQRNGRITNAALADRVNLSQSPCLQRTKRLEDAGVIRSYGAEIDLNLLGNSLTVFTEVTLQDHQKDNFRVFEAGIAKHGEVLECHLVSGGHDYLLKFLCRDILDYQETIERILADDIGIEKYFSYIVIKSPIAGRRPDLRHFTAGRSGTS